MEQKLKRNKRKFFNAVFIILCILPLSISFLLYYAYPIVTVFFTAFCKWDYLNLNQPKFSFEGMFDNFIYIFTVYPYFKEIMKNSFLWMFVGIFLQVPFTILVALVLSKPIRFTKVARNIFVVPNIISGVAMGIIFLQIYNPSFGFANVIIKWLNPKFNGNILMMDGYAFIAITLSYFFFVGTTTMMLLGQICAIPVSILEAAKIDGASGFKVDIFIILPLVKGMIGTLILLAGTSGFVIYDNIKILTQGAGSTMSISYAIRQLAIDSSRQNFGRANALGLLQFLILIFVNLIVNIVFKPGKKVY